MGGPVIFVPSTPQTGWVSEVMPGISAGELPIAGRRVIDYVFEKAVQFGAENIRVLDWNFSESLDSHFAKLTNLGYKAQYIARGGVKPRGLSDLEMLPEMPIDDDVKVIWGLTLPLVAPTETTRKPVTIEEYEHTPEGLYQFMGGHWMRIMPRGIEICRIKDWFDANFRVLRRSGFYTLPGYSAEEGVHIGRNVVIEHGTELKPPLILCDDVWCGRNVTANGNVIVGTGSFIAEGAILENTVIGKRTFVGSGVDLSNKIVIGNRIIDPVEGTWADVEEEGLVSHLRQLSESRGIFGKIWRFLHGTSRGRRS